MKAIVKDKETINMIAKHKGYRDYEEYIDNTVYYSPRMKGGFNTVGKVGSKQQDRVLLYSDLIGAWWWPVDAVLFLNDGE